MPSPFGRGIPLAEPDGHTASMPQPSSAPDPRPRSPAGTGGMPVRVVLADDSPDFRDLLAMRIAKIADVELVAAVGDGQSAVEAVSAHAPDVALLDVSMPGVDGFEAARRVRETAPSIRVVLLTGHPTDRVADDAEAVGADAVVQKGTPMRELLAALRGGTSGPSSVG